MAQFIYKCCGKSFNGIFPYKEHLENKSHDKTYRDYTCEVCNRRYDESLFFITHCLTKRHRDNVESREILNRVDEIQQLRKLNSTTCSSVLSNSKRNFKCSHCEVNISNIWTEADKHYRSDKHIKNLIENEIYKMLNLNTQNLPSRPAQRERPINSEKLSEQQRKVKMEIQRKNSNCNSEILKKKNSISDKNCGKSSKSDSVKRSDAKIAKSSQSQKLSLPQEAKYKQTNREDEIKKDKSKLPNSENLSNNTSNTKHKSYIKCKSSNINLKKCDKIVKQEVVTVKSVKTITTTKNAAKNGITTHKTEKIVKKEQKFIPI